MSIKVACTACGKRLSAKDELGGRRTQCPACGGAIEVPSRVSAAPKRRSVPTPRTAPPAAQELSGFEAVVDEDEGQYVSPPFRPPGSSAWHVLPEGRRPPNPARAGWNGSPRSRGLARERWLDPLSRSLGRASIGVGGGILIVGLSAHVARGGAVEGALLIVVGALAAMIAGSGLLLLADVARSLRRLSRRADRDAGHS
jgi:DNA-directed RNA polymerase subunit RPC12/RpoP